jgi:hypothetical protein
MTNNCVRNDGQSYNPVNPDSDRKKGERTKGRKGEGYKRQVKARPLVHLSTRLLINHLNHNSDKRGRMGESMKGRKVQATSISSWLACLLPVACCLLPISLTHLKLFLSYV